MQLTQQPIADIDRWHEVNPNYVGPIHSLIQRYLGDNIDPLNFRSYNHREEREMVAGKPRGIILLNAWDNSCGYVLTGPGNYSSPAFIEEKKRIVREFLPNAPILFKSDAQIRADRIDGTLNVMKQMLAQRDPSIEFIRKVVDYPNNFGGLSWRASNG